MLSKATKRLYFFKLLKRAGVPCAQLQHFYVAVIRSILEYAAPVWHNLLTNRQSDQIEAVQKRAINIIHSPTHGMPYSNALFFAGLTSDAHMPCERRTLIAYMDRVIHMLSD